jgi:hypothetical protein
MAIDLGIIDLGIGEGAIGIVILIVVVVFWIMNARSKSNEERGTSDEKKLTSASAIGFDTFERYFNKDVKLFKWIKKRFKKVEVEEKEDSAVSEEKGAPTSIVRAKKAGVNAAKTARVEAVAEEYTAALEGRGVGLLASVKAVVVAVKRYLARKKPSLLREEQDVESLEEFIARMGGVSGGVSGVGYLKQLFIGIVQAVGRVVGEEEGKKTNRTKLIELLKSVMKEARGVINAATTALKDFTRAKRKVRNYFGKELGDISKAIKTMEREQENSKTVSGSGRKLRLLNQQDALVRGLRAQFQSTDAAINKVIINIGRLLREMSGKEKRIDSFENAAELREQNIEKRFDGLKQSAEGLKTANEKFRVARNQLITAKEFAGKMRMFYDNYKAIATQDVVFDKKVRDILSLNAEMAINMKAYERLSIMLIQGETAVEQGLIAADKIVSTVAGGENQTRNINKLTGNIRRAGGQHDYEARVDTTIAKIAKDITSETTAVNNQMTGLVGEDERLVEEIKKTMQESSTAIDTVIGYMPGNARFGQKQVEDEEQKEWGIPKMNEQQRARVR